MNYLVCDSKRGKVFNTVEEAVAYRNYIIATTRIVVAVLETTRKVTHEYKLEKVNT